MLFFYELKQILVLVKQLASASSTKTFLSTHMVHHFPIQLVAIGGIQSKH